MTDKTREDFEAWARANKPELLMQFVHGEPSTAYKTALFYWQSATQQSAARIAYVEKVAGDAIELGNQQSKRIAALEAEVLALRKDAERQISDGEFEPSAKLMELADKIDHEQNWRNSGIFQRDHLTQDQQDRVLAGVMLRRYADLMAPESWRLFPPARARAVAHSYRASTLEAVVKMAKKYCRAAIEAERGEG